MTEQAKLFPDLVKEYDRRVAEWTAYRSLNTGHTYVSNKATETSRQAAKDALPKSGSARAKVYEAIKARGAAGLTDSEIALHTMLPENSARPRRLELLQAGLIVDSGMRRTTPTGSKAIAWVIAPKPPEAA